MQINTLLYVLGHALAAAAIFFVFQRFALGATYETSALWAGVGAAGAAILAYTQSRNKGG